MADIPIDIKVGDTLVVARKKMQSVVAAGLHDLEIVADPVFDARLLLMHALSISQIEFISDANRCLTEDEARKAADIAAGRAQGIPVARLIGEAEFWSLPFYLSSETLIPRPDSERVVEAALEHLGRGPLSLLDVGTGTGCIALAVLSERENTTGIGIDISEDALDTANKNAVRLGLEKQFSTVQSNLFAEISDNPHFDVIVSNPPYIASNVIESLGVEVRDHDPRVALDGGSDGLDVYRCLITQAGDFLAPSGALILEIGYDQATMVAGLLEQAGYESELLFDLGSQPRVLVGHKIATNPQKKSF
ncbi:MAG: peptide chain release factor N(5)-glutamine methyltransferase [Hyphomicrobiales bacterium]